MDIRILEYFLAVAAEKNITRAASRLHLTQPTLSRQIMQLEEEVGAQLFIRESHRMTLTDAGLLFQRRARDMVDLAGRAKEEIRAAGQEVSGTVAIGLTGSESTREIARIITDFQKEHPGVKFSLTSGSNEEIEEKLALGVLDFGLFLLPVELSGCERLKLRSEEEWGVLLHKSHPLYKKKQIVPGDLVGTKVVTITTDTALHQILRDWSGDFAKEMDFCATYNVLSSGAVLARERKGALICLKPAADYEMMGYRPFAPKIASETIFAWRSGRPHQGAQALFLAFVRKNLQDK